MLGIYGVLSNLVPSRIREIGIRMAIGASPAAIGQLALRQCLAPVAIGLAAGLAGSLALGRFLEALLFQVHPRDPLPSPWLPAPSCWSRPPRFFCPCAAPPAWIAPWRSGRSRFRARVTIASRPLRTFRITTPGRHCHAAVAM
jgi:ABC-type antimicrobial peptide transport system permease subunit